MKIAIVGATGQTGMIEYYYEVLILMNLMKVWKLSSKLWLLIMK